MKIREMIRNALSIQGPRIREVAFRVQRWAELAAFDASHVVEIAMEERGIRALAIGYQVDPDRMVRAYRQRVRAEAWKIRREFEETIHDGEDPGGGE